MSGDESVAADMVLSPHELRRKRRRFLLSLRRSSCATAAIASCRWRTLVFIGNPSLASQLICPRVIQENSAPMKEPKHVSCAPSAHMTPSRLVATPTRCRLSRRGIDVSSRVGYPPGHVARLAGRVDLGRLGFSLWLGTESFWSALQLPFLCNHCIVYLENVYSML